MKQSIRNTRGEIFYEAEYESGNQWISVRLMGDLTLEDIQRAADSFLELFRISGVRKLINDTTKVEGQFKGIQHWTVQTTMSELSDLGLNCYAHIARSDQRKIDRVTSVMESQGIDYKVFKNSKKAEKWLKSCAS